ncbi:hypothetical protein BC833DRAFT_595595 [Globomyces pollinis-pini]|nr:hypothetical protein BC833DRAFT_595595 [Globomyces pollinis-pini]
MTSIHLLDIPHDLFIKIIEYLEFNDFYVLLGVIPNLPQQKRFAEQWDNWFEQEFIKPQCWERRFELAVDSRTRHVSSQKRRDLIFSILRNKTSRHIRNELWKYNDLEVEEDFQRRSKLVLAYLSNRLVDPTKPWLMKGWLDGNGEDEFWCGREIQGLKYPLETACRSEYWDVVDSMLNCDNIGLTSRGRRVLNLAIDAKQFHIARKLLMHPSFPSLNLDYKQIIKVMNLPGWDEVFDLLIKVSPSISMRFFRHCMKNNNELLIDRLVQLSSLDKVTAMHISIDEQYWKVSSLILNSHIFNTDEVDSLFLKLAQVSPLPLIKLCLLKQPISDVAKAEVLTTLNVGHSNTDIIELLNNCNISNA